MRAMARAGSVRWKNHFIKSHGMECPIEAMCRVLWAAHSGYYKWLKRQQETGD